MFIKVNNGKNCSLFLLLMKFYLILRRLFPKKKSELNKNKELKMIIVPVKEGALYVLTLLNGNNDHFKFFIFI